MIRTATVADLEQVGEGVILFYETKDMGLVRSILTNPRVYRRMANDDAPPVEKYELVNTEGIRFVVNSEPYPMAVFLLVGEEVHFCMLPSLWGKSTDIAKGFIAWAWANGYSRLTANLPSYNRLALKLARAVGFRETGCKGNAVMKNGTPYASIQMELERA